MLTYVIRRLLLIPPTLIGMTAIVFLVLATAPGGIGASLLSRTGEMRPDERKAREDYLNRRYGLNKSKPQQYFRWLNKITPIGFDSWEALDEPVVAAAAQEAQLQKPLVEQAEAKRSELAALNPVEDRAKIEELNGQILKFDRERRTIDVSPDAGDVKWSSPTMKKPDMGDSFAKSRKVSTLISEALPKSILLQLISVPISYAMAVWLGVQQATRRGSAFDTFCSAFTLAAWSFPVMLAGVLLIGYLANKEYIHLFPANQLSDINADSLRFLPSWASGKFNEGWLLDRLYHCVLPVVCLTYGSFAFLSRLMRGALLDNLGADFVRTARAKGLAERVVLYRHAFRNSLIPLITVMANLLPALIAGSVIVENIFGIEGMGKLAVGAAQQRDFELLLSITLVGGLLQMIGYILTDIGYAIADPRVSYA